MRFIENIKKENNFDFSKNTTYCLGGKAKIAYFPSSEEEAIKIFDYLNSNQEKFVVLGNGSNVLVSDNFFDGAVISTKYLNKISVNGNIISCQSGVTVSSLLSFCVMNGLGGLEYLAGIPASVGGLAFMNAGIKERHVSDDIKSVSVFDGKFNKLDNKNCNFGNKHSIMCDTKGLILKVDFNYMPTDKRCVEENIRYFRGRRASLPKGKSCGCVFKNPEGQSAGKLIDGLGLGGFSIGNAYVSPEHANFIINNGSSSQDVCNLISYIKQKVFESCGVTLEEEVIYIGEFNDFNG